jgi:hypothetical protein
MTDLPHSVPLQEVHSQWRWRGRVGWRRASPPSDRPRPSPPWAARVAWISRSQVSPRCDRPVYLRCHHRGSSSRHQSINTFVQTNKWKPCGGCGWPVTSPVNHVIQADWHDWMACLSLYFYLPWLFSHLSTRCIETSNTSGSRQRSATLLNETRQTILNYRILNYTIRCKTIRY